MKLKMLLWVLEKLMRRALRANPRFRRLAITREASILFETADKTVKRRFVFANGSLTTRKDAPDPPDLSICFQNAETGFSILTSKDRYAFLNGINSGKIVIQGDFALLLWFKALADAIKPGRHAIPPQPETVGFVGLGFIGGPMARALLRRGFSVKAYDLNKKALEKVTAEGAFPCASLADIAAIETIVIMVNNMAQVRDVVLGLMEHLPKESRATLIIMSTVSPDAVRELRAELNGMGRENIALVDAPVSGAPILAEAGELAIYTGGESSVLQKVLPVLQAMGDEEKIFHMGELGAGLAMKLVNNILAITVGLNVNEAMHLGMKKCLDPDLMARAINSGSGKNFITENWPLAKLNFEMMLDDDTHNAKSALFITGMKDLDTAKTWAENSGISMPSIENAIGQINALSEESLASMLKALVGQKQKI